MISFGTRKIDKRVFIYFQKCMYVFIMRCILTDTRDSFYLADGGGISGILADGKRVRQLRRSAKALYNMCMWHRIIKWSKIKYRASEMKLCIVWLIHSSCEAAANEHTCECGMPSHKEHI
jgi:hypothetical protein